MTRIGSQRHMEKKFAFQRNVSSNKPISFNKYKCLNSAEPLRKASFSHWERNTV